MVPYISRSVSLFRIQIVQDLFHQTGNEVLKFGNSQTVFLALHGLFSAAALRSEINRYHR